ncbi:hypothetical protein VOLCADRAFT_90244 [Volvox carteri f. nagariensis]|uniref:Uncharacterized protein n=1 Tax=Volvox carteri f. nagariensis TaxID=3068 RepID=D8TTV0_VOLCA|nr:uncharacterized protein VOLCADRAFT_90244 [Volvox carteri f. nagariensis]EFJ48925.1 hypothetical protein VOLCADRAFT_90244 [Volvox carteri f. nagariensis]|eukprot:XP_002949822.1 hypothetical protein VOLCADRAFT_90244 [Volvox carteri f. nagariensis]
MDCRKRAFEAVNAVARGVDKGELLSFLRKLPNEELATWPIEGQDNETIYGFVRAEARGSLPAAAGMSTVTVPDVDRPRDQQGGLHLAWVGIPLMVLVLVVGMVDEIKQCTKTFLEHNDVTLATSLCSRSAVACNAALTEAEASGARMDGATAAAAAVSRQRLTAQAVIMPSMPIFPISHNLTALAPAPFSMWSGAAVSTLSAFSQTGGAETLEVNSGAPVGRTADRRMGRAAAAAAAGAEAALPRPEFTFGEPRSLCSRRRSSMAVVVAAGAGSDTDNATATAPPAVHLQYDNFPGV